MSPITLPEIIALPPTADMHVHLRDGDMMKLCTPYIRPGGVDTVYIMPNLIPPITTVEAALAYKSRLQPLSPTTTFLMTLYLHPSLTPEIIAAAAKAGISGVKAYPAGVTTNSAAGVVDWESFYPVFGAMQTHDLVLNLHGEVPFSASTSGSTSEANVLTAEALFLPTLLQIHTAFPKLRIVLEHCTTAAALDAVASCAANVSATITAHHLWITIDDVVGDTDNFCKPVAKTHRDKTALLRAALGVYDSRLKGRIMFGSDSAPHPDGAKHVAAGEKAAAGCFTQPYATQLVVGAVEIALQEGLLGGNPDLGLDSAEAVVAALRAFLSENARRFYRLNTAAKKGDAQIVLEKGSAVVDKHVASAHDQGRIVVNCFRGGAVTWNLRWTTD